MPFIFLKHVPIIDNVCLIYLITLYEYCTFRRYQGDKYDIYTSFSTFSPFDILLQHNAAISIFFKDSISLNQCIIDFDGCIYCTTVHVHTHKQTTSTCFRWCKVTATVIRLELHDCSALQINYDNLFARTCYFFNKSMSQSCKKER